MNLSRGGRWVAASLLLLVAACAGTVPHAPAGPRGPAAVLSEEDRAYLRTLAEETWAYIDAHRGPETGFPTDSQKPGGGTNTTNIGLYLASLAVAHEMGMIDRPAALERAGKILDSLALLGHRHGFLHTWIAVDGSDRGRLPPGVFPTSDFNKLLAGLAMTRTVFPELADRASPLIDRVEWNWLYDADRNVTHWGYDLEHARPHGESPGLWLASDNRLATFFTIASGAAPPEWWDRQNRDRFEADGLTFLRPGYEFGALFMHAICGIFLDERGAEMGRSVADLAWHQVRLARSMSLPAWGWSNCDVPRAGYTEGGWVPWWIVTPHASALAAEYYPRHAVANLRVLESMGVRAPLEAGGTAGGFRDSVDLRTGVVDDRYLVLDQAMLFLSLANLLEDGLVRRTFARDPLVARGLEALGDRLKADPALLDEWARRDAAEPEPVDGPPPVTAWPEVVLASGEGLDEAKAEARGGAKIEARTTARGLEVSFDLSAGGEADVILRVPPLDARALGAITFRCAGRSDGPFGGVVVFLRDAAGQAQYAFLGGIDAVTRDRPLPEGRRLGILARPQAVREIVLRFGRPWWYVDRKTEADRGTFLLERVSFAPAPWAAGGGAGAPAAAAGGGPILLADFDAADRTTNLGGGFGSWASTDPAPGAASDRIEREAGGNVAWRVEYDIRAPGSFAGTWMKASGVSAGPRTHLAFRVRGVGGSFSPSCLVEWKAGPGERRVGRSRVDGVGRNWTDVRRPLASFAGLGPPEDLAALALVFDSPTCPVRKGAYLFDDFRLE